MGFFEVFLISAALIGVAELGDKSQLALISLSGKYGKKTPILIGSLLGFAFVDAIAVIFGGTISSIVPKNIITILASLAFIGFGIYFLFEKDGNVRETRKGSLIMTAFFLITLMELGDKTQLLTITLSARYDSIFGVFFGAMMALMIISSLAILLGKAISEKVPEDKFKKASAILFILIGIIGLIGY